MRTHKLKKSGSWCGARAVSLAMEGARAQEANWIVSQFHGHHAHGRTKSKSKYDVVVSEKHV